MKKAIYFISLITAVLLLISPVSAEKADNFSQKFVITEVCFNPGYKETNSTEVTKTSDVYEYIEIVNTSGKDYDLTGCRFTFTRETDDGGKKDAANDLLFFGSPVVKSGEAFILCCFFSDTYKSGARYSTDAEKAALLAEFNEINFSNVTPDSFALIPSVDNDGKSISGTSHLANSYTEYTLTLEDSDGVTLARVDYDASANNQNNTSLNFAYSENGTENSDKASVFLGVASCTPGRIRTSQLPSGIYAKAPQGTPFTLMVFNICASGIPGEGLDEFKTISVRNEYVFDQIKKSSPDILCLQEVNNTWWDYIESNLTEEYEWYGLCSYGMKASGSTGMWDLCNLVMLKKSRYTLIDSGRWWDSAKPSAVGSSTWGDGTAIDFPRCVNWVIIEDKTTNQQLFTVCCHFDAKNLSSREKEAELMITQVEKYGRGLPAIICGDFNARENTTPYKTLEGAFTDTKYIARTAVYTEDGGNWSDPERQHHLRLPITHCFVKGEIDCLDHRFLIEHYNGYTPSDHSALFVKLTVYSEIKNEEPETTLPDAVKTEAITDSETESNDTTVAGTQTTAADTEKSSNENLTVIIIAVVICALGLVLALVIFRKKASSKVIG